VGDSARPVMTDFRGDGTYPSPRKHSRYRDDRNSETVARVSAFFGIGVLLLAATLLVVLGLPAFLDGLAVLARSQPGLAGIMIGVLGILRLLSHFALQW
jgi:hypothetical protein